ncbi:MAG: RibD family protein [Pseudomonadota bacterium]
MFLPAAGALDGELVFHYDADLALTRLTAPRTDTLRGRPGVVIGQLGQSLDGRIATPTGASKYINGRDALTHLHRLRASVDAVVVGVGTAIADNPRLTCRHVDGRHPVRVVIDPRGRLPHDLEMLSDGRAQVLVVTTPGTPVPPGAEALEVEADGVGSMPPCRIVDRLSDRGLTRLLIEGGAETLARFMDAGTMDELHLMLAPIVLGSGKTGLNLAPICGLDEALRPRVRTMRFDDGDMLCVCEFESQAA